MIGFLRHKLNLLTRPLYLLVWHKIQETERYQVALEKERLKSSLKKCGQDVRLNGNVMITGTESVSIGNNVHIGDNAWIRGEGGLTIGDNTHISRNLVLYTMNHDYLGSRLPYDENYIVKPVLIGDNVWIGMNCSIAPGTIIGNGVIVGIGTSVFGTVPPLAIIGSAPWQVLSYRPVEHYEDLVKREVYGGVNGTPIIK